MPHSHNYECCRLLKCRCSSTQAVPWHQPRPISHTRLSLAKQQNRPLSKLKRRRACFLSKAPSSSQLDNKQPHRDMSSVLRAEQRAFSPGLVRLSERERGKRAGRKRETLYVVGIDCCSVNGHHVNSGFELLIKKENLYPASGQGSVGLTGASSWSMSAHTSWDSSLQTQTEWEELGRCPKAFTGVCHLLVNCQVLLISPVPPSEDQSNNMD